MKYIDTHVHIGDYRLVSEALKTSKYRGYYRLYDSLVCESVQLQDNFISKNEFVFGIPIVVAEIPIFEANSFLYNYSMTKTNVLPIYLIGDNPQFYINEQSYILKEHFIHHNSNDWKDRFSSYDYLNSKDGFLLLHSLASIRIEYIKLLRSNFPKLHIIIAHMGRDGKNTFDYMASILSEFKSDSKIFFDTSTVNIPEYLKFGINKIGSTRILYGSDFPYECSGLEVPSNFYNVLFDLDLTISELENICFKNALQILNSCR